MKKLISVFIVVLTAFVALGFCVVPASADILFVSNIGTNSIDRIDLTTGADLGVFATVNLNNPQGLAIDSAGNVYVSNVSSGTIEKFSPAGTDLGVFASGLT